MRTPARWTVILLPLALAACGGDVEIRIPPPEEGQLRKVASAAELEQSLKAGLTEMRTTAEVDLSALAGDSAFSRTYTQELEVDEFDSVKYDGERLYVAPTRGFGCCWLAASTFPAGDFNGPRAIRVFETDPDNADATLAAEIPLADDESVQGMYLTGDRLIALTATSFFGHYGDAWTDIAIWVPQTPGFKVFDTSGAEPALLVEATFDGHFIDSRRVGDTFYIVSRFSPAIDGVDYWPMSAAASAANEQRLATVSIDEMLPTITIDGQTERLVEPTDCYVANDGTSPGYPVLTTITAVPVDDPGNFQSICYNDDAYGAYVSESAVYLTQGASDPATSDWNTWVHKFALAAGGAAYRGSAEVDGDVWRGGQADFRMDEEDGLVRLFTTEFLPGSADRLEHRLYILGEDDNRPALEIRGHLPNSTRPQSIGKPNEDLFGVRFIDDRVYAVTFERIDPLYVIDLTDPSDPRIAGELDVPGTSDLLHPVSDALLLGLGRSADNRIKLELYDVSNIAQPLSAGVETLGGPGSFSEAQWNRHAFTYLPNVGDVDRLTLPADLTGEDGAFPIIESGLYLFEVRDKTLPNLASLAAVGGLVTWRGGDPVDGAHAFRHRGVLDGDAVYYVRDNQLYSAFWTSPEALNGPL